MSAPGRTRSHVPSRPTWRCRDCAAEWPCNPARLELLAEYARDPLALRIYLAGHYVRAIDDFAKFAPNAPVDNLYDRFVGWPNRR